MEKLKAILRRRVEVSGKRDIFVNIGELSRELKCSKDDVLSLMDILKNNKEIKRFMPEGFSKDDYSLTVPENSSILSKYIIK